MDSALQIALIAAAGGLVGGLITGIIAPHVAWGIEKKKQKLSYRRELISKWRAMLQEVAREKSDLKTTRLKLESHGDFYSLWPHLKQRSTPIDDKLIETFSPELSPLITHLVLRTRRNSSRAFIESFTMYSVTPALSRANAIYSAIAFVLL